jgi:hypothetical protein
MASQEAGPDTPPLERVGIFRQSAWHVWFFEIVSGLGDKVQADNPWVAFVADFNGAGHPYYPHFNQIVISMIEEKWPGWKAYVIWKNKVLHCAMQRIPFLFFDEASPPASSSDDRRAVLVMDRAGG